MGNDVFRLSWTAPNIELDTSYCALPHNGPMSSIKSTIQLSERSNQGFKNIVNISNFYRQLINAI